MDISTTAVLKDRRINGLSFGSVTASSVEFTSGNAGNYVVDLMSPQGRKIKTLGSGYSAMNRVRIRWDGEPHFNRLLWIRLSQNGHTAWHKWIGTR